MIRRVGMRQRFKGKNVEIARIAQHACNRFQLVESLGEPTLGDRRAEHAKRRAQPPQCNPRLMQIFRIAPGQQAGLVGLQVCNTIERDGREGVFDRHVRGQAWCRSLYRSGLRAGGKRVAALRLAAVVEPDRQFSRQLERDLEQGSGLARFEFELDFADRFTPLAGSDDAPIQADVHDVAALALDQRRAAA